MKKTKIFIALSFAMATAVSVQEISAQQGPETWTQEQLMDPAALADKLENSQKEETPLILAVNPDGMYGLPYKAGIKGSTWFGPAEKEANLKKLESYLKDVDRDREIVLYCGCCPFHMCPNIRPAFSLLTQMGFNKHMLLNIPKNIKENWIDKGYPMND